MADTTGTELDIASRLMSLMPRLHHTLKRDRMRLHAEHSEEDAGTVLSDRGGQYRLLGVLLRQERFTTQGLAGALEVSPPTVSTMIRRLVEHGLVVRERDDGDQRIVWITITEDGRQFVQRERDRWHTVFLHRFEQLSPGDQDLIRAALPAFEHLLATDPHACTRKEH